VYFVVVSREFSKKADHGRWLGAKTITTKQRTYHDPPEEGQ
jgi:hypothetical protein